ncbi:MAG TPA: hypothetical protein VFI09_00905 [Solirubrobacterales bacterium]|nr:hypothetical protein [Solirubrobacterales bacterium]
MAAAGQPISHEFRSASTPDAVIRDLVLQADEFDRLGYRVESHTPTTAVLVRRFTPTLAYAIPLTIAALAFAIPVLSPDATTQQAGTGGRIAMFAVIAAVVLSLLVKTTERVTFSAGVDADGSRVLVSGSVNQRLRDYILGCGTPLTEEQPGG